MSVLSALQSAAIRLIGQKPTAIFSSTSGIALELSDLVNEAATDILRAHEWTKQLTLCTLPGDGSTTTFDLPSDFDRCPKDVSIFTTQWPGVPFRRARDLDEWYFNQRFVSAGVPGWWIMLGGQLQIYPAPAASTNVQFYYIGNKTVTPATGATKAQFTADDDTFRLPERLLTLNCIWRWLSQKGKDYGEHMQNYEIALSQEIVKDKGPRIIAEGRRRLSVPTAYPGTIVDSGQGEVL